jgi:hypothetical protein
MTSRQRSRATSAKRAVAEMLAIDHDVDPAEGHGHGHGRRADRGVVGDVAGRHQRAGAVRGGLSSACTQRSSRATRYPSAANRRAPVRVFWGDHLLE